MRRDGHRLAPSEDLESLAAALDMDDENTLGTVLPALPALSAWRRGAERLVNDDDAFAPYWRGLNEGRDTVTFGFSARANVHPVRERGGDVRIVTPAGEFPQH